MLWILYNLLFPFVLLFMLPKFIWRMLKRGGYRRHFLQRIGFFGSQSKIRLQEHRRIWIHAVSVGELYVALQFIRTFRAAHPKAAFALSTTTSTAYALGCREIDERDVLFYFPVDFPLIVKRVLRIVNPQQLVLVEGELWPNLIRLAERRGIPVALLNGRMSERSWSGYRKLRPLVSDVLRRIDPICVQYEGEAQRMRKLGAPEAQIHVTGTAKFDIAQRNSAGEQNARKTMRHIHVPLHAVVLLGGSTWPGEEAILCELYKKFRKEHTELFLIIAPRHVERSSTIIRYLEKHRLSFVRRSQYKKEHLPQRPDVLLLDTTGELRCFYAAADIIFVGKSLCERGGQNPIEPAVHGKAVLVGPHMEHFPAVMSILQQNNAVIQAADSKELEEQIGKLLADSAARAALGKRAAKTVAANQGSIERTVQLLDRKRMNATRRDAASSGTFIRQ